MPAFIDKFKQSGFAKKFTEFVLGKREADEYQETSAKILEEKAAARNIELEQNALNEQAYRQNQAYQQNQAYSNSYGYVQRPNSYQYQNPQNNEYYQNNFNNQGFNGQGFDGVQSMNENQAEALQQDENFNDAEEPNFAIDDIGRSDWQKSVRSFGSSLKDSISGFFSSKFKRQRPSKRQANSANLNRQYNRPYSEPQNQYGNMQPENTMQNAVPNFQAPVQSQALPPLQGQQPIFCVSIQNIHDCHHAIAQIVKPYACIIITIPKLVDLFEVRRYVDMLLGACQVMNLTLSRLSSDNNYFIIWSDSLIDLRLDAVTSKIQQDLYSDSLNNMMNFSSAFAPSNQNYNFQDQYQTSGRNFDVFADFPPVYNEAPSQSYYSSGMMN